MACATRYAMHTFVHAHTYTTHREFLVETTGAVTFVVTPPGI